MNAKKARELSKVGTYATYILNVDILPRIKSRASMGCNSEAFYFDGSKAIFKDSRNELKSLLEELGYNVDDNGFLFLVKW